MPSACGMPPRSGSSQTRFDSCSANWPSRKNASRGVVATQFGLPRPALRNLCVAAFCCEKSRAQLDQLVLQLEGAERRVLAGVRIRSLVHRLTSALADHREDVAS